MKKSLIAVAALAATSAFAQSSVSIYGVADVWFGSSKTTNTTAAGVSTSERQTLLGDGGVSSSRIGFKGTEDLGGGLKANFVLEQGFNMTNGAQATTGQAFSRQANVGLSGAFGAVQLGKVWTPYDDVRAANNDTFNANVAASTVWLGYEDNPNSTIKYTSPNFNGFTGSLSYSLGGDKTAAASASSVFSLGAQYANGPVSVGFAHQQQKQTGGASSVFSATPFGLTLAQLGLVNGNGKTKYTLINGSYNFGVAKLVGGFNTAKQDNDTVADFKATEYNLGVEVPLASNLVLGVGYAQSKLKNDAATVAKSTGFSTALVYNLSKRTAAYAAVKIAKNKAQNSSLESKNDLYAVGVNHSF